MKKRNSLILSLCMAFVMIFLQMSNFVVFAVDAEKPEDHLILHYDFLGDSTEEQLANKGNDKTAGGLTMGTANGATYIENGVAHVSELVGNYLQVATVGNTLKQATDITFFLAFRVEGDCPGNIVELLDAGTSVGKNDLLRWKVPKANPARSSVTFLTQGFSDGAKAPVFELEQWILGAVTLKYNPDAKTVTGTQYLSANGGMSYAVEDLGSVSATEHAFASAASLIFGKIAPSTSENRGRAISYKDIRVYDMALSAEELSAICPEEAVSAESYLITHYDFSGATQAEQLRDKALAGSSAENLTFATTTDDNGNAESYIRDGVAYVNQKKGNYLLVNAPQDIQGLRGDFTVFAEFKAEIDISLNTGDILNIPNLLRATYSKSKFLGSAIGSDSLGSGPAVSKTMPEGKENSWIRVAYVGDYDPESGSLTVTLFYSVNGGETWESVAGKTTSKAELPFNATSLLLGKINTGMVDRGISFYYNDVRVYKKALTAAEISSIQPTEKSDISQHLKAHFDFIGNTDAEKLTDKVSGSDRLTFANPKGLSELRNGTAYISSAAGNYLQLKNFTGLAGNDKSMTCFVSFKAILETTSGFADIMTISNTLRLYANPSTAGKDTIYTRIGNALATSNATEKAYGYSAATQYKLPRNKQVYLAVTMQDNGNGNYYVTLAYSTDRGNTWQHYANGFSGITINDETVDLLFAKVNTTVADRGTSFLFEDIRLYDKALSVNELKQIIVNDSPDIVAASVDPATDFSTEFYLPLAVAEQYDTVRAEVTFMEEITELTSCGVTQVTGNGNTVPCLTFRFSGLTALMMSEKMDVCIVATKGNRVIRGESMTSTVADRIYELLNAGTTSDGMKQLCVDALNFGSAVQMYFGYNTDRLANANLTDEQKASGADVSATSVLNTAFRTVEADSVKAVFYGASVSLKNPYELRFKVRTNNPAALTVVITDGNGKLLDVIDLNGAETDGTDIYVAATGVLKATDMRSAVYATVYENYGTDGENAVSNTLRYSVESYAASKLQNSNALLAHIVRTMLRYGDSAQKCAGN